MIRRRLPIGIQTFRELREANAYYVDKTPYVLRLLGHGKHFFLSRPRRFGKSLFLDTLKELFEGSEELFAGLHIHDRWIWSVRHPVVRLSFGSANFKEPGRLDEDVTLQLEYREEEAGIPPRQVNTASRFRRLLQALHRQSGQRVAVLVDEYDKPILDALEEPETARANRDYLRGLYGVIKDCDAHVRFAFLTGVSKFSKVNLFSQLNNLIDITLDRRYSGICGYTEADLDTVFASELAGLDREQMRDWYNGYRWRGAEKVYNPYDVLLLFDSREYRAHWFIEQPWAAGHGGVHRRARVPVRVQGGGDGTAGIGAGADAGTRLRGQVPGPGRADPPDRRGVQPRDAQRHRVRGSGRLRRAPARRPCVDHTTVSEIAGDGCAPRGAACVLQVLQSDGSTCRRCCSATLADHRGLVAVKAASGAWARNSSQIGFCRSLGSSAASIQRNSPNPLSRIAEP